MIYHVKIKIKTLALFEHLYKRYQTCTDDRDERYGMAERISINVDIFIIKQMLVELTH